MSFSRRHFLNLAGAGAAVGAGASRLFGQQPPVRGPVGPRPPYRAGANEPYPYLTTRSTVSLIHGDQRRKNVHDALVAIDDKILPLLRKRKTVVIKPNCVNAERQLAATHVDALNGILDYLGPRYKGEITIAESSGATTVAFANFKYQDAVNEHKSQKVKLVTLNEEGKYGLTYVMDYDMHIVPVRLAARLIDPDAFIICSAMLKTHNMAVATMSVKNMVLGAPLSAPEKETPRWSDKRKYHVGIRQSMVNMVATAQRLRPYWGVTVLDGYEGMEGNGPSNGTPVDHRVAVASTDYIAADRVGLELMGIDAGWPGYLNYAHQMALGQFDLARIDVVGEKVDPLKKKYRLHEDVERMLQWQGEMKDLPGSLGD
jgi:uncharacterized protein (DUF362 family)